MSLLVVYLYFTNKDIGSFLRPGEFIPMPGGKLLAPGQRLPTLWEIVKAQPAGVLILT